MTPDEKLAAILAAVQIDPGNRGLAKDPHDNLFTACREDYQAACKRLSSACEGDGLDIHTGFYVPTGIPPAFETDGPLGATFTMRAFANGIGLQTCVGGQRELTQTIEKGLRYSGLNPSCYDPMNTVDDHFVQLGMEWPGYQGTHLLSIEHVGRALDNKYYSMRARDISLYTKPNDQNFLNKYNDPEPMITYAIGDGGNEIGMGKIPHETIVKNIPNGDLIHCRVPADYLIVAGVSNWGAYALAAGVFVLRGEKPPPDLFDPDLEKRILEIMVREGPLVDGVTGEQTATVDGLSWDEYIAPFNRIREILES
jgi:hypothetical protein